jgi:hypothetical protein
VIWATQVLENLAKKGLPTRAELSDAAMSERAECVMLNKGPFIVEAVRMLDEVLTRMAGHQRKKMPIFRALRAWEHLFAPERPAGGNHPTEYEDQQRGEMWQSLESPGLPGS